MKRYLNSFFITLSLYLIAALALFSIFADEKIIVKKSEPLRTISLNHIEIKKEVIVKKIEPKKVEKKKVEPKKIEKKKIVKKVEPKKIKPKKVLKKKVVKKKIVKKKSIKKKKVRKIVKTKEIEKLQDVEIAKVVEEEIIQKDISTKVVTTTKKVNVKKEYLNQHLALIRKYIKQNVKYPKRAKRLRIEDIVKVRFTLLTNGSIKNITIISGNKHLQKATIKAIQKASAYFPKVSKDIVIELPIEYKLI